MSAIRLRTPQETTYYSGTDESEKRFLIGAIRLLMHRCLSTVRWSRWSGRQELRHTSMYVASNETSFTALRCSTFVPYSVVNL